MGSKFEADVIGQDGRTFTVESGKGIGKKSFTLTCIGLWNTEAEGASGPGESVTNEFGDGKDANVSEVVGGQDVEMTDNLEGSASVIT